MMRRKIWHILVLSACVIAVCCWLSVSLSNDTALAQGQYKDAAFDELIGLAEKNGGVSVVVGLNSDFVPVGELAGERRSDQQERFEVAKDQIFERLSTFKLENVKRLGPIPYFAATLDAPALKALRESPDVKFIRQQRHLAPTLAESTVVIGAPTAWQMGFTGEGSVVAVLDTGIDSTHPFFAGKIVSEACFSTTSAADNTVSICPSGSGSSFSPNSALPCNFTSICSHGTHVGGIAAGNQATGNLHGVARSAQVVAIQVFSRNTVTNNVDGFDTDIISGLARVLELKQAGMNIASANLSLGDRSRNLTHCDDTLPDMKAAIDNLRSVGVATVFSSGNQGFTDAIGFPACISSAVSVGSTDDGTFGTVDLVSSFSNSASILDLLAPGQTIMSSVPGGSFANMTGTSMAAPHVSGAIAVLHQRLPAASVSDLVSILKTSGRSIVDTRNTIAKPRIDLGRAVCYSTAIAGRNISGQLLTTDCSLATGARFDAFAFDGTAGQRISISLDAGFDSFLSLRDTRGRVLVENDNGGVGNNARIPATSGYFILPETGAYTIYATSTALAATGSYSLRVDAAPLVSITGRVTTPSGLALRNAVVTLTDQTGAARRSTTSSFGVYSFDSVAIGESYILSGSSKRYRFAPKTMFINENLTNVDFIGLE